MGCAQSLKTEKPSILSIDVLNSVTPFIDTDFPPNFESLIKEGDLVRPELIDKFRKVTWR